MGEKGAKLTTDAAALAATVAKRLESIGEISHRKMFGGVGIFENGKMFAIVNSKAEIFLKADDENRQRFESAGASRHGKMPYYSVPDAVLGDDSDLIEWSRESVAAAHRG